LQENQELGLRGNTTAVYQRFFPLQRAAHLAGQQEMNPVKPGQTTCDWAWSRPFRFSI